MRHKDRGSKRRHVSPRSMAAVVSARTRGALTPLCALKPWPLHCVMGMGRWIHPCPWCDWTIDRANAELQREREKAVGMCPAGLAVFLKGRMPAPSSIPHTDPNGLRTLVRGWRAASLGRMVGSLPRGAGIGMFTPESSQRRWGSGSGPAEDWVSAAGFSILSLQPLLSSGRLEMQQLSIST